MELRQFTAETTTSPAPLHRGVHGDWGKTYPLPGSYGAGQVHGPASTRKLCSDWSRSRERFAAVLESR